MQFTTFASEEERREQINRRLTILVKDMEDRNWPWRKNMDRSPSPGSDRNRDRIADLDALSAVGPEQNDWKLWPSRGPVKPAAPGSARPTPPPSRPASARYQRPDGKILDSTRPSSAGGIRPSSAGGTRGKQEKLPPT